MTRSGGAKGVLLMVAASASFTAMSACVKALSASLPTAEILFFRCALPLPYLLLLVRRRGARIVAARRGLIAIRCVCGAGAMSLYFYGLGHAPLGDAAILGKTQPVFVAMLAPFVLDERAGWLVIGALAASLTGAGLIIQPELQLGGAVGMLIVLAAVFSACSHVVIRKLTETEDPATVVLDFTTFVALVSLVGGAADFRAPSPPEIGLIAGVAAFATAGQLLMTHAYQVDEAPGVAAAGYASVVFSMLLGWVFWAEVPSAEAWAGGALVVGAGLILVRSRSVARA